MKRGYFCIALATFLVIPGLMAQNQPLTTGEVVIKGKIAGIEKGTASISTETFDQKRTFEAPIVAGIFEMKLSQPSPTLYSITVKEDPTGGILLFADNGTATIEAEKGKFGQAKVQGGISNKEWNGYTSLTNLFDSRLSSIQEFYSELAEAGKLEPKRDSLERLFQSIVNEKEKAIKNWVIQRPKSFVTPFVMIINYGETGDPTMLRPMVNALATEVKASYYGNFMDRLLAQKEGLNIGKLAPAFSQNDANGKPVALNSFKGKYVLVDFWASWCGPCRMENPNLVRTYQKFKDKNFDILAVSLDNNKEKWLQAIAQDKLTWTHVSDLKYWKNEVALLYGVKGIPANFLLDKEGKIVAKGLRGPALEETLAKILAAEGK